MKQFDLLGIGNSVVDVLYEVDEEFIKKNNLQKSVMTLIDEEKAEKFYSQLKQGVEVAGGSVANSTVGFASLTGKPAFIGKIKDDNLGKVFSGINRGKPALIKKGLKEIKILNKKIEEMIEELI